ncbi:MAG: TonB-dependent receptor, partial [Gemmatimonadetes bacterium]|nr:TonB-dependent receptor [Gemmatimonadota bacterium]
MRLLRMQTFIVLFIAAVVSVVAVPGLAAQRPDSAARADTAVRAKPVVVTATRSERRVEDTPVRVEVVDEDEVAEKVAMTPGDVTMLLNESPGLRIQITSAALGGAGVRVQGLPSRYTMILSDGLPLLGAQSSGLGLLQLPPVDLAGAEVIKGISSALYGGAAMGGVINFLSRRPGDSPTHDFVANQTSRNGTDLVYFGARPFNDRWGATLLTSAHRQARSDIDRDGWIDLPRYARAVVRPRVFFDDRAGRTLLATAGVTIEERAGGTMPGALTPVGTPFAVGLGTARADAGLSARRLTARGDLLALRAAALTQRHRHRIGTELERDTHDALFAEATATMPRGASTFVTGLAWTGERYANRAVPVHDYSHRAPAAFVQMDRDVAPWLVVSSALRADAHNVYGTALSPRVSLLARRTGGALAGWNVRLSGGQGSFAPTPHTEETEATGLLAVVPLSGLEAERATGGSADVSGVIAL